MSQLVEFDFCRFASAGSMHTYDNLNEKVLNSHWFENGAAAVKVNPLPGFNFRPGVKVEWDNYAQYWEYASASPVIYELFWSTSYNQRSFVMWVYLTSKDVESICYVWGDGSSSSYPSDGFCRRDNQIVVRIGNSDRITKDITSDSLPRWYCLIATIDQNVPETKFYVDNSLVGTYAGSPGTTHYSRNRIGSTNSNEGDMMVGYASTYDHILTSGERQGIQDAFLVDSAVGNLDMPVISGYVYDTDRNTISGADVFLIYNDSPYQLVDYYTATSSGTYSMRVPYFGDFTLVSSNPPNEGARAVSFTLSGVPGSGTIAWHDGS